MSNTNHTFHATAVAAVNEALVTLGQDVLLTAETLSTGSSVVQGRKAAYVYEMSRMKVLRDHAWNFARCETPTTSSETGEAEMGYRSDMPPRCVRLVSCTGPNGRAVSYRVVGREIRSNLPIEKVAYTRDIEDLDKWTPDAYRALVLRLAADLAKPITGRINERQLQESAYDEQLQAAKIADARECNVPDDPWGDNFYANRMRGEGDRGRVEDPLYRFRR